MHNKLNAKTGKEFDKDWCEHMVDMHQKSIIVMRSILYVLAVILVIGWLLGVFVYSAKGLIHILIVLAVVALLLGLIRKA